MESTPQRSPGARAGPGVGGPGAPARVAVHRTDDAIASGGLVIHLEVDDVDAHHARIQESGHEASAPKDMPWGWRMSFFRDPDGHLFGIYQASN